MAIAKSMCEQSSRTSNDKTFGRTSRRCSASAMTAVVSVSPTKIDVLAVTRVKSYSGAKNVTFFAATDGAVI